MSKYHILMGKRVPVGEYDSDHLLRLILKLSKRCNKFALKHNASDGFNDGGVWVARGFTNYAKTPRGHRLELATIGKDPIEAAEKFSTMLGEHEEKYKELLK